MSAQVANQMPKMPRILTPQEFDIKNIKFNIFENKTERGIEYRIQIRRIDDRLVVISSPRNPIRDDPSEWCYAFGVNKMKSKNKDEEKDGTPSTFISLYSRDGPKDFQKDWYNAFLNNVILPIREKFVTEFMEKQMKKKKDYYCAIEDEKMSLKNFAHITFQELKDEKGEPTGQYDTRPALSIKVLCTAKSKAQEPFLAKMKLYDENDKTSLEMKRIEHPDIELGGKKGFNMIFAFRIGSIFVSKKYITLSFELVNAVCSPSVVEEEYYEIKKEHRNLILDEDELVVGTEHIPPTITPDEDISKDEKQA